MYNPLMLMDCFVPSPPVYDHLLLFQEDKAPLQTVRHRRWLFVQV